MMSPRRLFATAALTLVAALAVGCAGLPDSGTVNPGLSIGDVDTDFDPLPLPDGPSPGAGPEEITEGFMNAASSPIDNFAIARQFLSPELAQSWRPDAAVTIDRAWANRQIETEISSNDRHATVLMTVEPVATLDADGNYLVADTSPSESPFELARNDEGEWRITAAADGIVLDQETFPLVFRPHSLQFYDASWEHLVPDPRWFPRVPAIATVITQSLVGGAPNGWLAESVRTAFPPEVSLARDAVPIDSEQVADVALTIAADSLSEITLARMRTQLERSLADAGVRSVRFTIDGRELPADLYPVVRNRIESNAIVLDETSFGTVTGDGITPIDGVSDPLITIVEPIAAIDVAGNSESAAVQLVGGQVYRVGGGAVDLVDEREGLIPPSVDAYGFIWTVPRDDPHALHASPASIEVFEIDNAWPDAASITNLRIAPDGVRVAAAVRVGGSEWLALSSVIRDEAGVPVRLGPMSLGMRLPSAGLDLAWLGDDVIAVLVGDSSGSQLIELTVGGAATSTPVPDDTVSIAGANRSTGVRLLSESGVVSVKRGTSWQESITGVLVLATQTGI